MLIFDRLSWPSHRPWVHATAFVALVAIVGYVAEGVLRQRVPDGTSFTGFFYGVLGGIIITFELLLWPRKWKRAWRILPVQSWMRAHIWLGLLSVPLLVMHSGLRLGGTLSTWLALIFLVVIGSGIYGLVLQQWLPKKILRDIPAETISSQVEAVSAQFLKEADELVAATCGTKPEIGREESKEAPSEKPDGYIIIGAMREVGGVHGKVLQTQVPRAPVPESDALKIFHEKHVVPFLRDGTQSKSDLRRHEMATVMFENVRSELDEAAHGAVDALETLCDQRRQFDEQKRLHWWLHSWLWIHAPLSIALLILMILHAVYALRFW